MVVVLMRPNFGGRTRGFIKECGSSRRASRACRFQYHGSLGVGASFSVRACGGGGAGVLAGVLCAVGPDRKAETIKSRLRGFLRLKIVDQVLGDVLQ